MIRMGLEEHSNGGRIFLQLPAQGLEHLGQTHGLGERGPLARTLPAAARTKNSGPPDSVRVGLISRHKELRSIYFSVRPWMNRGMSRCS